jgi:hypothetical protein
MAEETRAEKVARLIEKHVRDRNMDPASISKHYNITHFGIELDPDFFEARLSMSWGLAVCGALAAMRAAALRRGTAREAPSFTPPASPRRARSSHSGRCRRAPAG